MFYQRRVRRAYAFLFAAVLMLQGGALAPSNAQQESVASSTTTTSAQRPVAQPAPTPRTSDPTAPQKDDDALQDDEVLRVETDLTNVLFTAVDRNKRFVTTLRQEDIRVTENGVPQEIFAFQRETDRPLSLAIVIDTSGSQERTLPEEKSAARAFVDAIVRPMKDEVAVLSFTGEATLELGLTGNVNRIRRAIDRVEFVPPSGYLGGGVTVGGTSPTSPDNQSRASSTAIWEALWVTSDEVLAKESSDKTRRAIILLSDGIDTSSTRVKMAEAVERAIKADAVIYAIGIGDNFYNGVDEGSLRKVSERTGGRAFFPRDEEDLRKAFAQIQQELRSQYLVA
jgi:VWFA-related protein